MIKHPALTPQLAVALMLNPESLPDRPGASPKDQVEAKERILQTVAEHGADQVFRTICAACEAEVSVFQTAICQCGGFICAACQRIEGEGTCDHERPAFLPADAE